MQKINARAGARRTTVSRSLFAELPRVIRIYPPRGDRACAVPTAIADRVPRTWPSRNPAVHESPRRTPPTPRRPGSHRYDEAGVRLDVESPPARQPCSQPNRNADPDRRPATPPWHRPMRGLQRPDEPHAYRDGPWTRSPLAAVTGAAQAAPGVLRRAIRRRGKRGPFGDAQR